MPGLAISLHVAFGLMRLHPRSHVLADTVFGNHRWPMLLATYALWQPIGQTLGYKLRDCYQYGL